MELTAKQRKDLRKALIAAFPDQPRLGLMVEDELGESLNRITQGEADYELAVQELVKWAESGGKLYDLVMAASVAKPGNPQLRQFVQDHFQNLLEISSPSPSTLFSFDILTSLITNLNLTTDYIGDIFSVCIQTLPDLELEQDYREVQDHLRNSDFSSSVKWLVILRLLLRYGKNSKGQLYLVMFAQNLQQQTVDSASKAALSTWLANLPSELQSAQTVSKQVDTQARPFDEALRNLQAYFVITVEPPEVTAQTTQYGVNGYAITELGLDGKSPSFDPVTLQDLSDDGSNKSVESRQQKKGLFCTLQQIEHNLPDWLLQAQAAIYNRCAELQSAFNLKFCPTYDLTVEFWLPFEHLTAAADAWKIYSQPVRFKRRSLVVGQQYRVVVRSYDRFSDWEALNHLDRTWEKMESFFQTSPDNAAVHQKFEQINCWESFKAVERKEQIPMGLALTCPLCADKHQEQREHLFSWILNRGIPMALWSRSSAPTDHQEGMYELLTADTLSQVDQLLKQIKQTRYSADGDDHLGHHLAIWCDEPKRLRELKQFLKLGRLSA